MDRTNADKQSENPVFICVLYLRVSGFICGLKNLKLTGLGVAPNTGGIGYT